MLVTTQLYFSADERWQSSDIESVDANQKSLDAATSGLSRKQFTVPTLTAGTYRPILHTISEHVNTDGSGDSASLQSDWIPLRGTVTVGSC